MAQRIVDQTISVEDLEKTEKEHKPKIKNTKASPKKQKKVRSKNYKSAKSKMGSKDFGSVLDAIKAIKKASYAKFDESIEVHVNLAIDPQDNTQRIRFTTRLPYKIGKSIKVLAISSDNSGKKKDIIYRDETVVSEIVNGKLTPKKDFDIVVATPEKMKDLAKAAKILGPKGMMPSPKTNTVTDKIEDIVENLSGGQIEIKNQQQHAVIHQMVGKSSMKNDQIAKNIETLISEINKNKPTKTKGKLIKKITIASTMGVGVKTYTG